MNTRTIKGHTRVYPSNEECFSPKDCCGGGVEAGGGGGVVVRCGCGVIIFDRG